MSSAINMLESMPTGLKIVPDGLKRQPISFVTISHGHFTYVSKLIASILEYWTSPFELIIVDNLNSGKFERLIQLYSERLKEQSSSIKLYNHEKPKSFGVGNNFAIRKAENPNIFIINPDTRFIDTSVHDWFQQHANKLDGRLAYPRLLNADGTGQQHYNEWPHLGNQFIRLVKAKLGMSTAQRQRTKDWFFASAIITSKKTFSDLNGFEELFPLYCEDVDLCYKAKLLNISCEHITDIKMVHHLGGEAKHKHLTKAIISNVLWRYVRLRNYTYIKLLNKRYDSSLH